MQDSTTKTPLNIYVLYDIASEDAEKLYEHIYTQLCRDASRPLSDGLDIPVYLRTNIKNDEITAINYNACETSIVIILIDIYMYGDKVWQGYVKSIYDKSQEQDSKIFVLPVALCDYAVDFAGMKKLNVIKYNDNNIFKHIDDFDIRLYDAILSFLKNKPGKRLQIFISHAKKDGAEKAEELRSYITKNTKLNFFFDVNSIADGFDFETAIQENTKNSLLVALNSDAYSGRDWCQREITIAKEHFCPIVLVDLIGKFLDRSFPYLGNIPWVAYTDNNWQIVLKILLKTSLNYEYQQRLLSYVVTKRKYKDFKVIPFQPELFTVTAIKEKNIVYPNPILGYSEMKLLQNRFADKTFTTPSQFISPTIQSLEGKRIAISVSESDNSMKKGISPLMVKDFIAELARHIIVNGGKLIYGGNLQKDGYTTLFKSLARHYKDSSSLHDGKMFFTNYFSWPVYLTITPADKADFAYSRTETVFVKPNLGFHIDYSKYLKSEGNDNKCIWAKSLSEMRSIKERNSDILIIAGGKLCGFEGGMPGILEEFLIAVRLEHPVYILGGYGGMAEVIVNVLDNNISFEEFKDCLFADTEYSAFVSYYNEKYDKNKIDFDKIFDEIKNKSYLVNKGLSEDEKNILFNGNNIIESIELIFKGINDSYVQSV